METAVYPGAEGFAKMKKIMTSFRNDPPKFIGENQVTAVLDYESLKKTNLNGNAEEIDCDNGNVLVFECGGPRRRVTIRPSGTEPKLKFYFQWREDTDNAPGDYPRLEAYLGELYKDLAADALERAN